MAPLAMLNSFGAYSFWTTSVNSRSFSSPCRSILGTMSKAQNRNVFFHAEGHEIGGHEIDGHEIGGLEIDGLEIGGLEIGGLVLNPSVNQKVFLQTLQVLIRSDQRLRGNRKSENRLDTLVPINWRPPPSRFSSQTL